ncbi:MAG: hypothetical protein ACHBNF_04610 [Chromatiales bacterium]
MDSDTNPHERRRIEACIPNVLLSAAWRESKAAAQNQSVEQALRDIVSTAVKPTRAEVLLEMDRIRRMRPGPLTTDSAELIREGRAER